MARKLSKKKKLTKKKYFAKYSEITEFKSEDSLSLCTMSLKSIGAIGKVIFNLSKAANNGKKDFLSHEIDSILYLMRFIEITTQYVGQEVDHHMRWRVGLIAHYVTLLYKNELVSPQGKVQQRKYLRDLLQKFEIEYELDDLEILVADKDKIRGSLTDEDEESGYAATASSAADLWVGKFFDHSGRTIARRKAIVKKEFGIGQIPLNEADKVRLCGELIQQTFDFSPEVARVAMLAMVKELTRSTYDAKLVAQK